MLQVNICAENLKYIWRRCEFRPRATAWVDVNEKFSTSVDKDGDRCPSWSETLRIPWVGSIDDDPTLSIDIFDARKNGTEKLIGSTRLNLKEVVDKDGYGVATKRTLQLTRVSGRGRGDLIVEVLVEKSDTDQPDGQSPKEPDGQPPKKPDEQPPKKTKKFIKEVLSRVVMVSAVNELVDFLKDGVADIAGGL